MKHYLTLLEEVNDLPPYMDQGRFEERILSYLQPIGSCYNHAMTIAHRIQSRTLKTLLWIKGWVFAYCILPFYKLFCVPISNLNIFERSIPFIERREYAQNLEDGIIHAIFSTIGITNKYYVEFGVEDGMECNTRYLFKHKGWTGLLMDGANENESFNLCKEFITAENIEELFAKYNVPQNFDLLSIDIDGNDYWVWKAIIHYTPRVVIVEYNACHPWNESKTVPYDATFVWDKTDYYGATLQALVKLGKEKGYTLIATDSYGVNAFFIQNAIAQKYFRITDPKMLYHPAAFKGKKNNAHPKDPQNRGWVTV